MSKELIDSIRKISQTNDEVYSLVATVVSVNKSKRTCRVKPINGDADILDARLQANTEGSNGGVVFPKKDSFVIVTFLGKNTAYIALVSEVEKIKLSGDGYDLKSEIDDLLKLNSDILDVLISFKMLTNMGATVGVFPDIITKLQGLKQDNTNLGKRFAKVFE